MNTSPRAISLLLLLACALLAACRSETQNAGPAQPEQPATPTNGADSANNPHTEPDKLKTAIESAAKFLISKQAETGGFMTDTYGQLKSGGCTTALVLYAFSHLPEAATQPHREALLKGTQFLHAGIEKKGTVAAPDGTLDYPTYSAAMLLLADDRLKLELTPEQRQKLLDWLLKMQLTEAINVKPDSIHYGGWDMEAEQGGTDGDKLDGTQISLTSFALEALSSVMDAEAAAAVARAKRFVEGCQNEDGGFVFHRWRPHPGNKAGWEDEAQSNAHSYGSPTCDGLRSLYYVGEKPDSERMKAAVGWLEKHLEVKFVPGFPEKTLPAKWREGLRYYYYLTQAKALQFLPKEEATRRAKELRDILILEQRPDGSFKNREPRMFEDDELFATSLALVSLAQTQKFLSSQKD